MKVALYDKRSGNRYIGDSILLAVVGTSKVNGVLTEVKEPVSAEKVTTATINLPEDQFNAFRLLQNGSGHHISKNWSYVNLGENHEKENV